MAAASAASRAAAAARSCSALCSAAIRSCSALAAASLRLRSALACASARAFSADLTLKVSTARATSPISSLRSSPGSTTSEIAIGEFEHRGLHLLQRSVTRRVTSTIMKVASASAPARIASWRDAKLPCRRRLLRPCVILCKLKRGFGNAEQRRELGDRHLRPLIGSLLRLFAGSHDWTALQPLIGVVVGEKPLLRLAKGIVERRRKRQSGGEILERDPHDLSLALWDR